jgi:hypothetical protein
MTMKKLMSLMFCLGLLPTIVLAQHKDNPTQTTATPKKKKATSKKQHKDNPTQPTQVEPNKDNPTQRPIGTPTTQGKK